MPCIVGIRKSEEFFSKDIRYIYVFDVWIWMSDMDLKYDERKCQTRIF